MRPSYAARGVIGIAAAFALVACHRAPSAQLRSAADEGKVGDTTAFGPRILEIDRIRQRATYSLAAPAYVVLLAVAPGRSIDPLWVDSAATPSMIPAETRTTKFRVPGVATPLRSPDGVPREELPVAVQAEIDRCVRRTVAARTPRRPRRPRPVVRDSTGRPIAQPAEPDEPQPTPDAGVERRAEADCARAIGRRPRASPSDTHERYLVLLASSAPMSAVELVARLNGLTVTAEDAPATIAAIAEGLYFDRRATWSGYYVRW